MTINSYSRVFLIFAVLAIGGRLEAQVEVPGAESETEDETEAPPPSDLTPEPPVQLRPDEGSPVAGIGVHAPQFEIGRHFHLSASLNGGYDDNVNLTPSGSPSWYAGPNANVRYQFGSTRLAMDLLTGGGLNYYFDHPGGRNYDPSIHLELSLAYRVTPRLTVNFSTSTFYGAQPELSTALGSSRRRGNYFRSENHLSAHYRWTPRWSSVTSYSLGALEYASSAGQNRLEQAFAEELRYLLFPTTTASGEYRFSLNDSQNSSASTTQSLSAGLEQSFSPRFKATLRGGVQLRSSGNNGERTSPFAETSLVYRLGSPWGIAGLPSGTGTYITWTNRYSIEESDLQRAAGRETFRTNLALNAAITARISASLILSYSHGDNQTSNQISRRTLGASSTETTFDITPSLRYAITQRCSANVGYRYTDVSRGSGATALGPVQSFNSYTRNRYFAGITVSF